MDNYIVVGMADYKVTNGNKMLLTRDLGSCIGIALRDPQKGVGGLLHIMLPKSPEDLDGVNLPKYADTGIPLMVSMMCRLGARREKIVAKIVGGAHMYKSSSIPESDDISARNVRAVKEILTQMSIPILASDVEGYIPRTVIFDIETGNCIIKTVGRQDRII